MAKVKKTLTNPFGLTHKQKLAVELMVKNAKAGKGLQATKVHKMVYNAKRPSQQAYDNMSKPYFRQALLAGLEEKGIIGANSKVEQRLTEGLDAIKQDISTGEYLPDYNVRLKYIQEINKVVGTYAPEKKEQKSLNVNLNMSKEELDKKIEELSKELG